MLHATVLIISQQRFPVWSIVGTVAGIYGFVRGFRLLQRKRLILNTPASKIRSASMGLVEISGLAIGPHVVISPIKQIECYYYRSVAWELKQRGKSSEWVKVAEEALHVPFYVDDNTGKLLIDPTGAEMDLHCDFHEEYHESLFLGSDVPQNVNGFLARHGVSPRGKIKVEEYCIKPENFLFVLGTLSQNPGLDVSVTPAWAERVAQSATPPDITPQKVDENEPLQQVIRLSAGAASVPVAQMSQQQKIAAALAKAGVMESMPWASSEGGAKMQPSAAIAVKTPLASVSELLNSFSQRRPSAAVSSASQPAVEQPAAEQQRIAFDPNGFDLHPPVILMKGSNEPTFFISWRSQRDGVNSLNWKSTLMIWGCPALVLACVYVLLMHLR